MKVTPADAASIATYASLVPGAPAAGAVNCAGTFFDLVPPRPAFPWPPYSTAVPPTEPCGSQRPGVNVAPAIAADGTIYTVSRAHFDEMVVYVVAVNPDLTPKWQTSLQNLLQDGCGTILPIANNSTTPNSCAAGTTAGVDPTTNAFGSGRMIDEASSTPTVLPDGVLFGTVDRYNFARGHMFKIDANGNFVATYPFGWDSTPAVYSHDGTYSIVIKDNHYEATAYCGAPGNPVCRPRSARAFLHHATGSESECGVAVSEHDD